MGIVMKDKLTRCLLICLLATIILLPVGCTSGNKFANDPVNWSFVSGGGTWDVNSREWTLYLTPGETKSAMIQLNNSGLQHIIVHVVLTGPPDTIGLSGEDSYSLSAGESIDITLIATAYQTAKSGSNKYTIHCGSSSNEIK